MLNIRIAKEEDIPKIRDIFIAVYGKGYPYQQFYDEQWLRRSVFSDDILMLVAEETETGGILGTASVVFDIGAYSDLIGEFGRLAVLPDARGMGTGKLLMQKRIELIQDRLHLGLIGGRVVHPYAQKIALAHQFVPVGFLPLKHYFSGKRECLTLLVRYFGDALSLRKNNPRIISEAYPLANLAMQFLSLPCDVIVDESSLPYPHDNDYQIEELSVEGLPSLLRIERGRVRNREIFGHIRIEYGFFKLRIGQASYLVARDKGHIAGAIGFILDRVEKIVRVFEMIPSTDLVIRFLLSELERKCREEWDVEYIEIDVSAHATRMQRTLLELFFLPAAYIPAMVFHDVERLDIIRMVRLLNPQELGHLELVPTAKSVADLVMRGFKSRTIMPRVAQAVSKISLFDGLGEEQLLRFASVCTVKDYNPGEQIFSEGDPGDSIRIVLEGRVGIYLGTPPVRIGAVGKGEALGELSLLSSGQHSATATADTPVEAVVLSHRDLSDLIRLRPDIGLYIYKNLADGLGKKLFRSDLSLRYFLFGEQELPRKETPSDPSRSTED
ncbi:MAG TPA: GNAT family N-acetyltransferase [Nitrospiria bacterium]|nr:GNAT family N-acetyltransferase [Nitrospiria bacterium]